MKDKNEYNHQLFLKHLSASHQAVWTAALWMWSTGRQVTINPTTSSEKYKDRMKHRDSGDLLVNGNRVEVKKRGINFTGKDDWPHKDFLVCAKHSYDMAENKPTGYIIMSSDMNYAGLVSSETYDQWGVTHRKDSRYKDYSQDFYVISLDYVTWHKVTI